MKKGVKNGMKKRIGSGVLVIFLLLQAVMSTALAAGFSSFQTIRAYSSGQFQDVAASAWYEESVKTAYELGLFDGKSSKVFDPNGNITIAESIKLAVCLHSIYHNGKTDFDTAASPWYRPYVTYALSEKIIPAEYENYNKVATRAEFAVIFAAAFPTEGFTTINQVDDSAIPDISMQSTYAPQVYRLYRAGILIGSDSKGSFRPQSNITRGEVAAIVTRMALPSSRKSVTLKNNILSGEEVYSKCASAVFYIEIYDASGKATSSGSGFFLSANGLAVTNHHVIDDAVSAKIRTIDGKVYNVKGMYDTNAALDLALLQIEGSGFPVLTIGDTTSLKSGAKIYAIGSPLGLENTISEGIISNPNRVISGTKYIQITAPISHGSSGGALLNQTGQVIGVTSAGFDEGQNLNLAVPIDGIHQLSQAAVQPLPGTKPAKPLTLTPSQSNVSLKVGESKKITFTLAGDDSQVNSIGCNMSDATKLSVAWGDWSSDGMQIPLTITGKAPGTVTVNVQLKDENDAVLISTKLTVTVASNVKYYSGYYPVPDYGAYIGAPLYYSSSLSSGGKAYFYRTQDLPDAEIAVDGYLDLLMSNGFTYVGGFESDEGYTILVFENNGEKLVVYFGMIKLQGVPCMHLMVTPA